MTNSGHVKYANNSILTASPEELTLMLYNGAIKFCNKAVYAIEAEDMEAAHIYIIRVEDIIEEFQLTLNPDYEISSYLDDLYQYMMARLIDANITKDVKIIEEVTGLLRELRDTWKEAMNSLKVKQRTS